MEEKRFDCEKKRGPLLGIKSPQSRVPVARPRRDRTMGSSILASLSEAGGNDPYHPMNGPLPPHSPNDMDRVGTRPMPSPNANQWPKLCIPLENPPLPFQQLTDSVFPLLAFLNGFKIKSGSTVPRWNCATSISLNSQPSAFRTLSLSGPGVDLKPDAHISEKRFCGPCLSRSSRCRIMIVHSRES